MPSKGHTNSSNQQNSANNLNKRKKKKKKSKGRIVFRVILIILLLLLIAGTAVAFTGYHYLDKKVKTMDRVETAYSDFAIDPAVDKKLSNYVNIALLGVDARIDEDKKTTRTDAIIVVSINKDTKDITLTSVMRDSYLQIQDQQGQEMLDKVTHANVFGGPVNTCRALNKSLDLNISEFVVLDWTTVADTVDAIGGITVDVKDNEIWDLNHWGPETAVNTGRDHYTKITKTGKQKIDGVQAATYCRIRKNSGGDPGRTARMRKVVLATVDKIMSNPKSALTLAEDVFPSVTTNISTKELISLAPVALNFNMDNNYVYPFDYAGVKLGNEIKVWYAVPATLEENARLLHQIIFKDDSYEPTETCKELSQLTVSETGYSLGTEMNSTGDDALDKKLYQEIFSSGALDQLEENQQSTGAEQ